MEFQQRQKDYHARTTAEPKPAALDGTMVVPYRTQPNETMTRNIFKINNCGFSTTKSESEEIIN